MFSVTSAQAETFKQLAFLQFEDEMVDHVRNFFPNHFLAMKEDAVRATIRYARTGAEKYGLTTKRNVCLYLNTMLVLGSHFDTDPQYPWAAIMLKDRKVPDPGRRIDNVSEMMLDVFGKIRGPRYTDINRSFLNLHNNAALIFKKIMGSHLKDALSLLEELYPKKVEVVGAAALEELTRLGQVKAAGYGINSEPGILLFIVFMFLSGAGFDKDPQFPWASGILNDAQTAGRDQLPKLLFDKAISHLGDFLKQYKFQ